MKGNDFFRKIVTMQVLKKVDTTKAGFSFRSRGYDGYGTGQVAMQIPKEMVVGIDFLRLQLQHKQREVWA